ncbi:hypothetical protein H6789_02170 [Candidatus Nomurabacteria bacterium]|nr:hypothetical protein [Candidatus Nomurabacteria bacterium]
MKYFAFVDVYRDGKFYRSVPCHTAEEVLEQVAQDGRGYKFRVVHEDTSIPPFWMKLNERVRKEYSQSSEQTQINPVAPERVLGRAKGITELRGTYDGWRARKGSKPLSDY